MRARRRGQGIAVGVVGALVGALVVWVFARGSRDPHADVISDLAFLPISLTAGLVAWRVGFRTLDRRTGRAWRRIALAFLLWWSGDVLWAWFELVRHRSPFPSLADVGYLAFYPVLLWGVLSFPSVRTRVRAWHTLALDLATVVVGGAMVLWYFVVGPTMHAHQAGGLASVLSVAYPTGDLVLVFAIALVLLRPPGGAGTRALRALVGAIGLFVVADTAYAHLSLSGSYRSGDWPDALWAVAQWLMLLAAHLQSREVAGEDVIARETHPRISRLPYFAIALGYGLLVKVGLQYARYPLGDLLLASVALTGIVVTRQIAALRENIGLVGRLHELAITDELTGLDNRRRFVEQAARELEQQSRTGSVVMVDVDHFKLINDTYGHGVGDEVLRTIADRCREELRTGDVLARFGGDELVVLLPGVSGEHAVAVAERIRLRIGDVPVETAQGPVYVTLSLGVAALDDGDLDTVLARADIALYEAKESGRACTRSFTSVGS
jgi:diguanylate cyclase (GGDEF)-like protein